MIKQSLFTLFLFCSPLISAQNQVHVSTDNYNNVYYNLWEKQAEFLDELYSNAGMSSVELINGREYSPYYYQSKFKPLLLADKKHTASIILNGRKYNEVPLIYDTFLDRVIFSDSTHHFLNRLFQVALNKDNIDCFEFFFKDDTMSFRYFSTDLNSGLMNGFYEVVYDGESKYLKKHRSTPHINDNIKEYYYSPVGYINLGNGFFKIRSKEQFIKLFGDRSDEVRKFINNSKIKIRKADKKQMIYVLKFYDSLNNRQQSAQISSYQSRNQAW